MKLMLAVLLVLPVPCLADWQGALEIQGLGGQAEPSTGRIFARGPKVRVEVRAKGQNLVILADAKTRTADLLMPSQKMALATSSSLADKQVMTCATDDVEGCFSRRGFKVTGSDTVDGHPCRIYEVDERNGKIRTHQKVWRPTDLKEVFMVKSVAVTDSREITTHVKDIRMGKIDAAMFDVPGDYRRMQMPDLTGMH